MNNCHRYLSFPVEFAPNPELYLSGLVQKYCPGFDHSENSQFRFPLDEIPKEFTLWFEKTFPELFIKHWEVFYTAPGKILPIHSDVLLPFINVTKINIVYNSEKSLMRWFKMKDGATPQESRQKGHFYTLVKPEEADCIFESDMKEISLVNVGIPHGVDNTKNLKGRWCACLYPNFKTSSNRKTTRLLFHEGLEVFKDYIKPVNTIESPDMQRKPG